MYTLAQRRWTAGLETTPQAVPGCWRRRPPAREGRSEGRKPGDESSSHQGRGGNANVHRRRGDAWVASHGGVPEGTWEQGCRHVPEEAERQKVDAACSPSSCPLAQRRLLPLSFILGGMCLEEPRLTVTHSSLTGLQLEFLLPHPPKGWGVVWRLYFCFVLRRDLKPVARVSLVPTPGA